jgi:hypothetical protein
MWSGDVSLHSFSVRVQSFDHAKTNFWQAITVSPDSHDTGVDPDKVMRKADNLQEQRRQASSFFGAFFTISMGFRFIRFESRHYNCYSANNTF